jgi:phosphate-selective porin OprO and OprP
LRPLTWQLDVARHVSLMAVVWGLRERRSLAVIPRCHPSCVDKRRRPRAAAGRGGYTEGERRFAAQATRRPLPLSAPEPQTDFAPVQPHPLDTTWDDPTSVDLFAEGDLPLVVPPSVVPPTRGESVPVPNPQPMMPYQAAPSFGATTTWLPGTTAPLPPATNTGGQSPLGGSPLTSVFTEDRDDEPFWIEQDYERVLDLVSDGSQRELIRKVREVVETTEVGVDVTDEDWITVRGDGTRILWGGRVEGDWVNWARDTQFGGQPNYFEFRRLRLFAAGTGYGVYDYQLEFEFFPDNERLNLAPDQANDRLGIELKDAYLGIRDLPFLGYAVFGHIRVPVGLSHSTSTRFYQFMERSLNNRLMPGREVGVTAFNRTADANLTWAYGFYFHDLDELQRSIIDDNQGSRFVGRATWTPYYDEATDGQCLFHTGLGYVYTRPRKRDNSPFLFQGDEWRPVRFSARPEIHQGDVLIDTGDVNASGYHLLNAEAAYVRGPFSMQGELSWLTLDEIDGDTRNLYGAYVQGSYFLTGEHRPYDRTFAVFRRVIPYENFWAVSTPGGPRAGLGAWELNARWSHLNFDDFGDQRLHDITLGVNWYLNPNARVMFNWIHPMAHNSPVGTAENSEGDILALRMQLDF